jgi:uncharacterized protein YqeY
MIKQKLDELIAEATKSGEKDKVAVLRSIKNEFTSFEKDETNVKRGKKLDDATEVNILLKMKSQREDSITQFKAAGRNDLVEKENKELEILKKYIPEQPSDDAIRAYAEEICKEVKPESMRDTGIVLGKVKEKYPNASGKIVSEVVQNSLKK